MENQYAARLTGLLATLDHGDTAPAFKPLDGGAEHKLRVSYAGAQYSLPIAAK